MIQESNRISPVQTIYSSILINIINIIPGYGSIKILRISLNRDVMIFFSEDHISRSHRSTEISTDFQSHLVALIMFGLASLDCSCPKHFMNYSSMVAVACLD